MNAAAWFAPISIGASIGVLMGELAAQQPAPTIESRAAPPRTTAWSADDARMLSVLLQLRRRLLSDELLRNNLPGGGASGHYRLAVFTADDRGELETLKRMRKGQPFAIAAWPDDAQHRGFLVHSDGTTMVCEPGDGELPPFSADVALANGAAGKFADLLRQPGTSRSRHLWMWLDQFSTTFDALVVDERGGPRGGAAIVTGPVNTDPGGGRGLPLAHDAPVAEATTDAQGHARLRGPLAAHGSVHLTIGESAVRLERVRVEEQANALRIVVPDDALVSKACLANEAAAIATLKNIVSAQAQCQASAAIDGNNNGAGEYGFFGELSGAQPLRSDGKGPVGSKKMSPPVLSTAFGNVQDGRVQRSGYLFQLFLPAKDFTAIGEASNGGAAGVAVDPLHAEVTWCAYAWPVDEKSGLRAFFVNQSGGVLASEPGGGGYFGVEHAPLPTAAFAAGSTGRLDACIAANNKGLDGRQWHVVP
jgi:hypothetical protein